MLSWKFLAPLVLGMFLVLVPPTAQADQGDLSVGMGGAFGASGADTPTLQILAQVEASARLGLSDWVALEAFGALRHLEGLGVGAGAGFVLVADIFQWVPEVYVAGIMDYRAGQDGETKPVWGIRGELRGRYFLSMKHAVSVGLGAVWLDEGTIPFVGLNWLYSID